MAKNTKKPPIHNGKPITAFFARSTKGSPSTSQDASRPTKQPLTQSLSYTESEAADNNIDLSEPSSIASKSHTKVDTTSTVGTEVPNTARHSESRSTLTSLMSPISTISVKRSRSPDLNVPQMSFLTPLGESLHGCPGLPELRQSNFDGEVDFDTVNSTPNPKSKKRARLESKEPRLSTLSDFIPSSQSDEEELIFTTQNAASCNQATNDPVLSSLGEKYEDPSMEIDDDMFGGTKANQRGSQPPEQTLTPSPSNHPSISPIPVALDAASKTAKIIADIKAKAYAQLTSSPESTPLEFNDISDSSSDEEDFLPILPSTSAPSTKSSDTQTICSSMAIRRSTRNALKNGSPSATNGPRSHTSSNRVVSKAVSSAPENRPKQTKKASIVDPFTALLKEKRISQKNGKGSDAFNRAEIRTHSLGKHDLLDEMAEEESEDGEDAVQSEAAIALAIAQNSELFDFEDEVRAKGTKNHDATINRDDDLRKTLFGGGRAIHNILEQDKELKRHDESSEKTPGIDFWMPLPDTPNTAPKNTSLIGCQQLSGSSLPSRLLNSLLQHGDFKRAALLLNANFISSLGKSERLSIVSELYDLAFSMPPSSVVITGVAVHALEEFWASSAEYNESGISFSQILSTIQALGANTSIISAQEWPVVNVTQSTDTITVFSRKLHIQNLLVLIDTCARSKRLQQEDIPDIILALALFGMDKTTSADLWRDITAAINSICQCIANYALNSLQLQTRACSKLLKCVSAYDPVNKARLVYLLSGASGPARRIANVVAYCIITDKESPDHLTFLDTPPLPEVIDQLAPYSKSSASLPGKFALHDKTDYVDLGFYTTILGVAVSNLRSYVVQERQLSTSRNSAPLSPRSRGEKPKTDLQQLYAALETLHSNISDTRATHLERSRTKENIKGLAMNVHYQREHWLRNLPDSRAKTLAEYFVKKSKS